MRVDAWKLCQQCRRPEPRSCEDIGTWYYILSVIATAAVVTNSALIAFTGTFTLEYTYPARIWIFIGMVAGLLYVKKIIADYVPDCPREVEIQLERQQFYLNKILHNVGDDNGTELLDGVRGDVKYTIRVNDDDPL